MVIVGLLSGLFVLGAIIAGASVLASGDPTVALIDSRPDEGEAEPTTTFVDVTVLSVDPAAGQMQARIRVTPGTDLARNSVLRTNLVILTNDLGGAARSISAGDLIQPFVVSLPLGDGVVTQYPFDTYESLFVVRMEVDDEFVPVTVSVFTNVTSYSLEAAPAEDAPLADTTLGVVEFDVSRQNTTLVYALGVMAILISLGAIALRIIWVTLVWQVESPPWLFGFLVGALFAMPPLRSSLPESPPPGAIVDFLSFYPAIAMVAVAMLVALVRWLGGLRPE